MLLTISVGSFALTVAMGNALATAALDGTIDLAETTKALEMFLRVTPPFTIDRANRVSRVMTLRLEAREMSISSTVVHGHLAATF